MNKVFSFKFSRGENPLGYLLVESDIPDNAFDIAKIWKKIKGYDSKIVIEFHQRRFDSPGSEPDEVIEGNKVWELPF